MNSPLSKMAAGSIGTIDVFLDEAIAGKLMTMGVLPGSEVRVVRRAPFRGGVYLKIDGANLVLREEEAATIFIKPTIPPTLAES